ncbi:hypothetical protein OKE68_06865 [Riemerella anatipestifer]|uniref:Phosphoribosyl-ATP pyrophosphatase n=1 Tax=Riemerella anatipestifer TaxID=34085 RepID=A0AAP3ALQ0_RIEAN|nr:hypothetical protein [Riemerella anatipestifer]MCW0490484.1 hypothetical protein [Riemerella anatipestifer]MCW0524030.1 hypothetical protein [Riemerella anatipestifer]MDR7796946.1 hypothetical protein [Riemerella anatipestifer]MDY3363185.1 hypothetical protein [Riemerella anatipestifer]MDY3401969.1 hypothetical protein [Riemerella anatipestifer]
MGTKYRSLSELRAQKSLLKNEISDMEKVITFKNPKSSLSLITKGFTDKFIEERSHEGSTNKISINTGNIVKEVTKEIKNRVSNRNSDSSLLTLKNEGLAESVVDGFLKVGLVGTVSNYAKKNLKNPNWKKRAIGLLLVYVAPLVIRQLRTFLDDYQRKQTAKSINRLI